VCVEIAFSYYTDVSHTFNLFHIFYFGVIDYLFLVSFLGNLNTFFILKGRHCETNKKIHNLAPQEAMQKVLEETSATA